jgi:YVTN family beta-propeller protein
LPTHASDALGRWTLIRRIPLQGPGGWDYLAVQPGTHRLFVSHAGQVIVIDLSTNRAIASIPANGVHGIAFAPELNRGFISNGGGNNVTIFNLATLKTEIQLPTGTNPDAICYEPQTRRVFAFNGKSATATVIDAVQEKVVSQIPLGGKPEFAQVDGRGFVFDNLEDKSEVIKISAATLSVVATWALPSQSEPSGLAIDAERERLFVGCGNKTMVVMDAGSGRVLATLPIGAGVDACVYDPVHRRAFASCGDGTMTIVQQSASDNYTVTAIIPTAPRARTMAYDPAKATAYLPTAKFGSLPQVTPQNPKPRPPILPGSLEIVVLQSQP